MVPTIPWWVFAVLAVGLVLNAAGGGLAAYVRTILLGVGLLVLASLVGWTTRLSDLVDALPCCSPRCDCYGYPSTNG